MNKPYYPGTTLPLLVRDSNNQMSLKPEDMEMLRKVAKHFDGHRDLKTMRWQDFVLLNYLIDHPRSKAKDCATALMPHLRGQTNFFGNSSESGGWRLTGRYLRDLHDFVTQHRDGSWSAVETMPCEHEWRHVKPPIWVISRGKVRFYYRCALCGQKSSCLRPFSLHLAMKIYTEECAEAAEARQQEDFA